MKTKGKISRLNFYNAWLNRENSVLTDSSNNDGMASTSSSDPVNPPSAEKKSSQLL